jgi:asparagine synthase (glutamine-hydrolysing)
MCGISAVFSQESRPLRELVVRMNNLVVHRGPDGNGVSVMRRSGALDSSLSFSKDGIGTAALGHTRLAIVDLSPNGHQPMSSLDDRFWITYNGEIYNYQELRQELEGLGECFKSQTDTEVILIAYARWGADCLHRFNGMFAFVLVDRHAKQVFAARDRFGVKPLYYWRSADGILAFASEIKQFTVLPGWEARLDAQLAYDFLNWGVSDHTSETLFSDVRQLRGGEYALMTLEPRDYGICIRRWYQLPLAVFEGDMTAAAAQLGTLLDDSVRLRLRSDVPVGSCLSGGIDSSSIVCVANRMLGSQSESGFRQQTFSARASISRYDEGSFIEHILTSTGVNGHQTTPSIEQLFETLPAMVWHQDEPFGSTSIYAQWQVFKLTKDQGVKVILDGQGADELFAGYHGYFGSFLLGLLRSGDFRRFAHEVRSIQRLHGYSSWYLLQLILNNALSGPLRQVLRAQVGKVSASSADWMNVKELDVAEIDPNEKENVSGRSLRAHGIDHLLRMHLPMLLHWEDRSSMAHSVEARVPFLDYRLVEFAFSLKDCLKVRDGMTKAVLREAMHGVLPEAVRTRVDKLGFVTPEEIWVREQAPERFRKAMRQAIEQSSGVLNDKCMSLLNDIIKGGTPFSFLPWRIIAFGSWVDRFNVVVR